MLSDSDLVSDKTFKRYKAAKFDRFVPFKTFSRDGCCMPRQPLFHKHHFLQQMVCASQLVYGEEDIADVKLDVAAIVRVEFDVAHRAFPYAVEIQTDQVAVLVYHRTS